MKDRIRKWLGIEAIENRIGRKAPSIYDAWLRPFRSDDSIEGRLRELSESR